MTRALDIYYSVKGSALSGFAPFNYKFFLSRLIRKKKDIKAHCGGGDDYMSLTGRTLLVDNWLLVHAFKRVCLCDYYRFYNKIGVRFVTQPRCGQGQKLN